MEYVIKNREPADVLRYFEEISAIPRGSGNEKAIGEYLLDFAAKLGLEARMDDLYNVVIKKPASPGCEHLDPVILQGHTDMVCEKNKNVEHDFTKDGIKLVVDGDILRADGTTLGADNGQAVACMMAFLARKDMKHPPLECVFTSQEEVGLIGAIGFDPYDLKGTRMINMDCGPEGVCVAGSAGGTTIDIYKTVKRVPFAGEAVSLKVRGLKGGHSGSDIDKERGNANKIAARVLYAIAKEMKVNLVSMDGGMMMNAIPRECDAVAAVADAAKAAEIAAEVEKKVKSELEFSDPGLTITLEPAAAPAEMICDEDSDAFLKMLYLMPAGLVAKSMALEGLTVASQNLAAEDPGGRTAVYPLLAAQLGELLPGRHGREDRPALPCIRCGSHLPSRFPHLGVHRQERTAGYAGKGLQGAHRQGDESGGYPRRSGGRCLPVQDAGAGHCSHRL